MIYNPDKHHRRSIRLKEYDYSQAGAYFVTICAQNRDCLFGDIIDREIQLNTVSKMVRMWWNYLPKKYPNVELDDYTIMPNHLHGIIVINDHYRRGEVTSPLQSPLPQPTLGKIIAYFKYQSTKYVNQLHKTPGIKLWQRNYYEHIIRDENEINRIRKYIIENPLKWDMDNENPNKMESN
jgi:REP element-mobilizing transposase RayT